MSTLTHEAIAAQRHRFDMFNVARIFTAISLFSPVENAVFGAVPLLLHRNHSGIDGLQSALDAPAGIQTFTPRELHHSALAELAPGAAAYGSDQPKILSLALIGSLGTVAQTHKSDFDYVIFIDKRDFTEAELRALHRKLGAIEQWAEGRHGVEVHFFVQDTGDFRLNLFGITDRENVGSALGKLFKDEFYRTAIWVAGRKPLWWIIPPDYPETEASILMDRLKKEDLAEAGEYVDLGHLLYADEAEFFGAALWQINKALGSPFKSVLKMALLESYLFSPVEGLLCEEVKRKVLDARIAPEDIDPYLMMFERGSGHYAQRKMENEVALLKWAFILKTGITPDDIPRLLKMRPEALPPRERVLAQLMKRWGWHGDEGEDLQTLFTGDPHRRLSSVARVYRFFTDAYVRLSDFKREHGTKLVYITQDDMTVLGRKLFTHFEQTPGKIPFVPRAARVVPPRLTLQLDINVKGERTWGLYAASPTDTHSGAPLSPLMRQRSLVAMVAWMVVNGVWEPGTRFYFRAPSALPYKGEDVEFFLQRMLRFFPGGYREPEREDYLAERTVQKLFAIPNFGLPESPGEIRRIDLITLDTWGEFRHQRLTTNQALMETAIMIQKREQCGNPPEIEVAPPPSQKDPHLVREFEYSLAKTREALELDTGRYRRVTLDLD